MSVETFKKNKYRVLIVGPSTYWVELTCRYLQRHGFICTMANPKWLLKLLAWLCRGQWRCYDALYRIGGSGTWMYNFILACTAKPVIWHWIGSDILLLKNSRLSRWVQKFIQRRRIDYWPRLHAADSPDVQRELHALGIRSEVIRLLPERIEAPVEPLPETFTVLSYWLEDRKRFYGGDIVMQLARELPEVRFLILGAAGDDQADLPNVKFLGWQKDLESFYTQSSALIRLPEHDSLSAMVLEMLARGRYIIYNKPMPGCHLARNFAETKEALAQIQKLKTPNRDGARHIQENFSVPYQAQKTAQLCRRSIRRDRSGKLRARMNWITLVLRMVFIPVTFLYLVRLSVLKIILRLKSRSQNTSAS
jgi:glycosyltransferase involved in cell wall biosynthesis